MTPHHNFSPVGLGNRICQLHLSRGKRHCNECPVCDTKLSDIEASVLGQEGIWSTHSLSFLADPLSLGAVVLVRGPIKCSNISI